MSDDPLNKKLDSRDSKVVVTTNSRSSLSRQEKASSKIVMEQSERNADSGVLVVKRPLPQNYIQPVLRKIDKPMRPSVIEYQANMMPAYASIDATSNPEQFIKALYGPIKRPSGPAVEEDEIPQQSSAVAQTANFLPNGKQHSGILSYRSDDE